jgi:hypothetical protein
MRAVTRSLAVLIGSGALVLGLMPTAQSVLLLPADPARSCAWPVVYPGVANYAWPDTHAAYINQALVLGAGEKAVITGRDPKARFWSITTYNLQDREVIDVVNDVNVKRKGRGPSSTWTVTVSPTGNAKDPNWLKSADPYAYGTPLDLQKVTVIMYRVYLSETATYSGGALPTITIYHDDGIKKAPERLKACAASQIGPPDQPLGLEEAVGTPSDYFVRAAGGRFYPSYDTAYLAAEVPYDADSILVVSGRAPIAGKGKKSDVRYWSLCQNINKAPLPVVDCVSDKDIRLVDGRYTIAVVGPGQVPDRSLYPHVTFVEWSEAASDLPPAFLIMRHILSSAKFANAIDRVEVGQPASTTMGDYAPVIEHLTLDELASR